MRSTPFLENIAAKIASIDPSSERNIPGVFQYNIKADDVVHTYFMDLKNLKSGKTTTETVDAIFNISDDDFVLVHTKQMTHLEAIEQGKLTVTGNMKLAEMLFANR